MNKVYVLGSLNIDFNIDCNIFPQKGETIMCSETFTNSGGKGANQAVACSKLGGKTNLIGCVGNDEFGSVLIKELLNYQVNTSHVLMLEKYKTGKAFVICSNCDNRIIVDLGSNLFITEKHIEDGLADALENDLFICQLETNLNAVYYGLKEAKQRKMLTILNPAPAIKLDESIYSLVDIIIANETEAEILTGIYPKSDEDCKKIYEILAKKGISKLIITLGKEGSIYLDANTIKKQKCKKVETVDTTGAGDTYIGALAYQLSLGEKIENVMEFCSKASALTVMKKGAQQSMPDLNDINQYFKGDKI